MVGPEGEEHWSIEEFTSITPKTNLKMLSAFADKDGNINTEWPSSNWDLTFNENDGTTKVSIVIKHDPTIFLITIRRRPAAILEPV